jgi:hypothetical protein
MVAQLAYTTHLALLSEANRVGEAYPRQPGPKCLRLLGVYGENNMRQDAMWVPRVIL